MEMVQEKPGGREGKSSWTVFVLYHLLWVRSAALTQALLEGRIRHFCPEYLFTYHLVNLVCFVL